jgi:hypothetical protein
MNEREYEKRKQARDRLERDLIKHGTNSDTAKKIADRTANETDNKRRQEGR